MKKIWLWNHDATCMYYNEGGRHYWFSKELKKNDWEPIIFCSNINHFNGEVTGFSGLYKMLDNKEIPFVFIKTAPYHGNGVSRVWNWITFYLGLFPVTIKMAKNYGRPDIILASSVHPLTMVAGIQISRILKVPCVCEIRDLWPEAIFNVNKVKENSFLGKLMIRGEHWIYKNADSLIFTKEGDTDYLSERRWLKSQGGDVDIHKCHYINNGVDLAQYKERMCKHQFSDEDLENDKFKIIYTGTIRKVNDLSCVLKCAELLKDYTDIQFLIYGDGDFLPQLKEAAISSNLPNIKFKGYLNRKYIPYILSKSSLNLLNYSSNLYNWSRGNSSNKLFEYMASGTPILSTVKMNYSPLEKYNCGLSLQNNSPEEMASAILSFKNMPLKERAILGRNAAKGAEDFDTRVLGKHFICLINYLLKERHSSIKF